MSDRQYDLDDLSHVMQLLRNPETGCPWDIEQTYASIVPSTIEEAYEVADAIERSDMSALREELGDLLFQTVFYCQLAAEDGLFTLPEVVSGLVDKLVRRHPHVFANGSLNESATNLLDSSEQVVQQWEEIKANEREQKGQSSLMDDLPNVFPALLRAQKLQKRASKVGFDWTNALEVFDKIEEEIAEVKQAVAANDESHIEEELGDLLFCCVNLVRKLGFDSETTLKKGAKKFEHRFRAMEALQPELNKLNQDQLEQLWRQVKMQNQVEPSTVEV